MTDSYAESFARLASELGAAPDFASTVDQVVQFAQTTIGARHAGVTLLHAGGRRLESVSATDPSVAVCDKLQYDLNEGPCLQAAAQARTLRSDDLANDTRWPTWGPRAAELGFHSILSVEMHTSTQRIGALNLYGERHRQFSEQDAAAGHLFAFHAAAALAAALDRDSLRIALDSRTLIGQAEGILMERFAIEAGQAFGVLRRYSQTANIKLHDVAQNLVEARKLDGLSEPSSDQSSSGPVGGSS